MKPWLLAVLAAAAALSVAACGGQSLDTSNVERDIQEIAANTGVETEAECPDEVSDAEQGTTYSCELTFAGNDGNVQTIEMEIIDDEARSNFANEERGTDELVIRSIVAKRDDGEPDTVTSVEIEGDSATVTTEASEGEETIAFERGEQGAWRLAK